MKMIRTALTAAALMAAATASHAIDFIVDARANSTAGGVGLSTISLTAGQAFSISVGANDLWSAGDLPRWSNANGLIGDLFATGTDESGQSAGTKIGRLFGTQTQNGLTARYGSLVGQIGGGSYFLIGTSFSGSSAVAGTLKLFNFDSDGRDNADHLTVSVTSAVPEPTTFALLAGGLLGVGFLARRRKV